ncbi:MAG: hypothetical protein Q9169_002300 [Polycauliona sp. 2 TL-2023]
MPFGFSFRRKPEPEPERDWQDTLVDVMRAYRMKVDGRAADAEAKFERNRKRYEREDREEEEGEIRRREERRRMDRERSMEGGRRHGEWDGRGEMRRRGEANGRHSRAQAVGRAPQGERRRDVGEEGRGVTGETSRRREREDDKVEPKVEGVQPWGPAAGLHDFGEKSWGWAFDT